MPRHVDHRRRRFLGAAGMTIAAARLGMLGSASAQPTDGRSADTPARGPTTSTSFAALKQVRAGVLDLGYAEAGPADGRAVILLHGWPYDIHSFLEVAPLLAKAGYRVIVPYLRGYGTTRFLSSDTFRNAQQSAVALDVIALMDALGIKSAIVGGFDWGARTADVLAALWPERCKAIVAVSGYLITSLEANLQPLLPVAELGWWYQYYFATERGRLGYERYRRDFNKLIWKIASPKWDFDDATYARTAASFDNPDHVSIVIHNYRWRLRPGQGRGPVRRPGAEALRACCHHRARDHHRQRFRRPGCGRSLLQEQVLGKVFAPGLEGDRSQRAPGSTGGVCSSRDRSRWLLTSPPGARSRSVADGAPGGAMARVGPAPAMHSKGTRWPTMTFRIEVAPEGQRVVLHLAGRFRGDNLGDLERRIAGRGSIVLDLDEVTLVGVEFVRFLRDAEAAGVELRHCPPFVREWIDREREVDR